MCIRDSSTNDYQGKEMQLAYEVQSKVDMKKENTPWPILIVDNHMDIKHELTPETAQQLFLDEKGLLNGSVSTVESVSYTHLYEKIFFQNL